MAKNKKSKERAQRFISILNPDDIDYSEFDAMTSEGKAYTNDQLSELGNTENNNSGRVDKQGGNSGLAGGSNVLGSETSTDRQQSISSRRGNSTRELLTDPASNIIQTKIPFTPRAASYNPLLLGNTASFPNFTKSLMSDVGMSEESNAPDVMSMRPLPEGNNIKATTPEDRFIEAMMNTNPSPQSPLKRLLTGLGRGLRESAGDLAQGNYGGAFGRIASNVIAGAIPGVNSATQYEQNKAQATERYKLDKLAEQGKLSREKTEADIRETNERLKLSQLQRQQQTQRDAMLDAARLRDDKRADADQKLKILEKLPASDPQRNEIARDLATLYQMRVSAQYGLNDKSGGDITIYDEQSGSYVRATQDGTPKTDAQGNMIVVRPGKQESIGDTKKRAMQQVIETHGGDSKSVARLSTDNRKDEIISSLPKQYQDALRNPGSTNTMIYDDAKKAYDAAYATMLKQNEAFTDALYEREAQDIMKSTTRQTTGSKQAPTRQTTGNKTSPAPGYFLKWK
jgi:hypothetical protein